jgi:mannose-6-phosphate isomerase class I
LRREVESITRSQPSCSIAIEAYAGVRLQEIVDAMRQEFPDAVIRTTEDLFLLESEIEALVDPFLGSDVLFGRITTLSLLKLFDPIKTAQRSIEINQAEIGILIGPGAAGIIDPDLLVCADLPRWEIQQRHRAGEQTALGLPSAKESAAEQYKRGYFVDWRLCDTFKRCLWEEVDWVLDTVVENDPKLVSGPRVREALEHTTGRPFRVVPFFDPAPWGGEWMRQKFGLKNEAPNYGWCFDCVPEENSLVLDFDGTSLELPAIDLIFQEPEALLGQAVYSRFGAEFPIRFDFLDTVGGGNLSLQVHPTTDFIKSEFGMSYTQDESYYLLDAHDSAAVYLGVKDGADRSMMFDDLRAAQEDETKPFPADKYAARWRAKKHDHFLIPAGTIHCSGAGSMVLEISATPYIFTFKLWDWGRLGLDGKPRPINIDRGEKVLNWSRDESWARKNLIYQVSKIAHGETWREERTGLHETEFIETHRHWFWSDCPVDTGDGVNVINLVEGEAAVIKGDFAPFEVHYAETVIIPAAVAWFTISPLSDCTEEKPMAIIRAFVRT